MTYRPEFSLFFVVFNISIKVINNFCGGLKEERKIKIPQPPAKHLLTNT